MSTQPAVLTARRLALLGEVAKLPAFLRRDILIALSYRVGFVTDWAGLVVQAFVVYFIGQLVEPSALPSYGGRPTGYMAFAVVGLAVGSFMTLALGRIASGIRGEQLMGTLESLLVTPTSPKTIQFGTVFYDLLVIPIRTALFLLFTGLLFGLDLKASGFAPALLVLLTFIPFVWGIGVANAALVLTFRRGTALLGFAALTLTMLSGAYFPLDLLPHGLASVAAFNPLAIAIEGMREALLGGAGFEQSLIAVAELLPFAIGSLALGFWIFGLALRRERRLGTIGLY
jgi:ABC-2 type transport system permease protein